MSEASRDNRLYNDTKNPGNTYNQSYIDQKLQDDPSFSWMGHDEDGNSFYTDGDDRKYYVEGDSLYHNMDGDGSGNTGNGGGMQVMPGNL